MLVVIWLIRIEALKSRLPPVGPPLLQSRASAGPPAVALIRWLCRRRRSATLRTRPLIIVVWLLTFYFRCFPLLSVILLPSMFVLTLPLSARLWPAFDLILHR